MIGEAMSNCGKVWLVGAGPGDAGLITVKGKALLELADVVIYDALIQLELLAQIPEKTKKIHVGKRAGNHSATQEQINQIILEEALKGKKVVRLKGGDPFVFGRGGEELELLLEHGIPFEIVPGITSAVSVLAYAGIPVTHREFTSSFHVITGHTSKGKKKSVNYQALAKLDGTLIFLMGSSSMEEICNRLMQEGMSPDTPAALLERGTTARQRKVISTLEHLKRDCDRVGIQTPAIIVVGQVCRLANQLEWVEKLPLGGVQVLVTREKKKASTLSKKLLEQGAHVIELPAIGTTAIEDKSEFQIAVKEIMQQKTVQWIVLTSPTGVEMFFSLLKKEKIDLRRFLSDTLRFAVSGSATAVALERYGIYADLMPKKFSGKDLGRAFETSVDRNEMLYLFRSELADEELPNYLAEAGFYYKEIPIYHTIPHMDLEWVESVWDSIEKKEIDYVTFTSASTVKGFVQAIGERDFSIVPAICIGEKTADWARRYGMNVSISPEATMDSMVKMMIKNKERFD